MLAWVLGLGLAAPLSEAEQQRLLGPEPVEATAPATAVPPSAPATPDLPWWPIPVALGGFGLLALARRRGGLPGLAQLGVGGTSELQVLGRTALGPQSGLTVVEVRDADGAWRRLLIAHSPTGPQLLTGLGTRQGFGPELDQQLDDVAVDDLPEFPAYAVPEEPPVRYLTSPPPVRARHWTEVEDDEPVRPLARVPRGYAEVAASSAPNRPPSLSLKEGLDLLAEVRGAKPQR